MMTSIACGVAAGVLVGLLVFALDTVALWALFVLAVLATLAGAIDYVLTHG